MKDVRDFAVGVCAGTGAAINVILGFVPTWGKVINMETFGEIEWSNQMPLINESDEGIKLTGTATPARAGVTTNGITVYNGGDEIIYDGETSNAWEDSGGTSKEEVYVDGHYQRTAATQPSYRCYGDVVEPNKKHGSKVITAEGITIGADTDFNIDGERLTWIFYR